MKLRVYSWIEQANARARELTGADIGRQVRYCVAAPSGAAAARIAGVRKPAQLFNFGETWNKVQVTACMANPGVLFVSGLDGPISDRVVRYDPLLPGEE